MCKWVPITKLPLAGRSGPGKRPLESTACRNRSAGGVHGWGLPERRGSPARGGHRRFPAEPGGASRAHGHVRGPRVSVRVPAAARLPGPPTAERTHKNKVGRYSPGSKSGTAAWYWGPTRMPPPPAGKRSEAVSAGGRRGRAGGRARGGCHLPCSSSLDEPELPSSQELLPLLPLGAAAAKLLF